MENVMQSYWEAPILIIEEIESTEHIVDFFAGY